MNQVQTKGNSKASAAVLIGVGAAAGAAALQSASASVSSEVDPMSSGLTQSVSPLSAVANDEAVAGGTPVEAEQFSADVPAAEAATNIEQLVDAYLNENVDDSLSVEALSEAELQDHLPESELQALISQPGVQVAQAGGGGLAGLFGGGGGLGAAAVIGGVVVGGYALNEVLDDDDDDSNGTV